MAEGREIPQFCSRDCYWLYLRSNKPDNTNKINSVSREKLIEMYESGMKLREIAVSIGISHSVLRKHFKRFDIPMRTASFYSENNSEQFVRNYYNKKYNHTCLRCGWKETTCDACHIKPRRDNGSFELENIILLCPNCHRMFDKGLISMEEILKLKEQDIVRSHTKL